MINLRQNIGHGHVYQRPDGLKARCGGIGMCPVCSEEYAEVYGKFPKGYVQEFPPIDAGLISNAAHDG